MSFRVKRQVALKKYGEQCKRQLQISGLNNDVSERLLLLYFRYPGFDTLWTWALAFQFSQIVPGLNPGELSACFSLNCPRFESGWIEHSLPTNMSWAWIPVDLSIRFPARVWIPVNWALTSQKSVPGLNPGGPEHSFPTIGPRVWILVYPSTRFPLMCPGFEFRRIDALASHYCVLGVNPGGPVYSLPILWTWSLTFHKCVLRLNLGWLGIFFHLCSRDFLQSKFFTTWIFFL